MELMDFMFKMRGEAPEGQKNREGVPNQGGHKVQTPPKAAEKKTMLPSVVLVGR